MGSSPSVSRRQNDDVPAPSAIMAYPPLAYFLNSLLSGLNFLRECPMLCAQEALLSELTSVLLDSSSFFVGLSSDLSARGAKYLPQSGAIRGSSSAEKAVAVLPMEKQYALVIAQDLVPHVLICFEHIFTCPPPPLPGSTSSTSTSSASNDKGSKGRGRAVLLHVDNLSSARSAMGPGSLAALTACWALFRKAELLPAERPVSLSLPARQPTQAASTTVTAQEVPVDPVDPIADAVVADIRSRAGSVERNETNVDPEMLSGMGGEGVHSDSVESREVEDPGSVSSSSYREGDRDTVRSHDD